LPHDARSRLAAIDGGAVVCAAQRLIAAASPNPPGNTGAVAAVAADILPTAIPGIDVALILNQQVAIKGQFSCGCRVGIRRQ